MSDKEMLHAIMQHSTSNDYLPSPKKIKGTELSSLYGEVRMRGGLKKFAEKFNKRIR
jgi:hypothetical protein